MKAVKAVIYTRVSQDRNATSRSVSEQEADCRAVCDREGWTVTRVFSDNDRSASRYATKKRQEFDSLREHIERHECDVLVTWEASRSNRDLATYVQLRDLCRERGVLWSYSGRRFDLDDDADQFGTGLDALLAERESAVTRKRVLRAMGANATAGRPHGRAAYGYRRTYDGTTKQLLAVELAEDEAAVLREAGARVLSNESLAAIARDFASRGLTTSSGLPWRPSHIGRMLLNPAYAGKRVHRGQIIGDAMWPAVFDEVTWYRLQAILKDPARHTAHGHHDVKYLLSGIATCGRTGCGAVVYLQNNRGIPSYMCSAGAHVSRKGSSVDDLVEDVLLTELSKPGRRGGFVDESPTPGEDHWASAEATRARLDEFADAAARGEITARALGRIEQKLLAEIARMEAEARRASVPPEIGVLGDIDVAGQWADLPIATKRAIIRHYLTVRVLPARRGSQRFDPETVEIRWRSART